MPAITSPPAQRSAVDLGGMTWTEFAAERNSHTFAILPVGSVEQHGPHLPLDTDTFVATRFAQRVAARHGAVVLPPVTVGVNHKFGQWPGSLAVPAGVLHALVTALARSVSQWTGRLMILNGHDENQEVLVAAARDLVPELDVVVLEWAHVAGDVITTIGTSRQESHAGELLTSLMLHWAPDSVRRDRVVDKVVDHAEHLADDLHVTARAVRPVVVPPTADNPGVLGQPSLATADKGARIEAAVLKRITGLVVELGWTGPDHGGTR